MRHRESFMREIESANALGEKFFLPISQTRAPSLGLVPTFIRISSFCCPPANGTERDTAEKTHSSAAIIILSRALIFST